MLVVRGGRFGLVAFIFCENCRSGQKAGAGTVGFPARGRGEAVCREYPRIVTL